MAWCPASLPIRSEALRCPRTWVPSPRWACLQFGLRHFPVSAWGAPGLQEALKKSVLVTPQRAERPPHGPSDAVATGCSPAWSPCGGPTRPVSGTTDVPSSMHPLRHSVSGLSHPVPEMQTFPIQGSRSRPPLADRSPGKTPQELPAVRWSKGSVTPMGTAGLFPPRAVDAALALCGCPQDILRKDGARLDRGSWKRHLCVTEVGKQDQPSHMGSTYGSQRSWGDVVRLTDTLGSPARGQTGADRQAWTPRC